MEIPALNSDPQCHLAAGDSWKREGWNFLVDVMLSAGRGLGQGSYSAVPQLAEKLDPTL